MEEAPFSSYFFLLISAISHPDPGSIPVVDPFNLVLPL